MGGLPVPEHELGHVFGDDPAFDGSALDTELLAFRETVNAIIAATSGSIRDDKTLQDGLVRLRNLHSEVDTQIMKRHGLPLTDRYSWRTAVLSVLGNPPAEPSDGDRYLVDVGAIGLWAGLDDRLVQWVEEQGEWVAEGAPQDGWMVWVGDPGTPYVFNDGTGEWVPDWGASGWGDIVNTFTTPLSWATGTVDAELVVADSGMDHLLFEIELSTAITSGWVTFEVYADAARSNLVWDRTYDLAAGINNKVSATYLETETTDTLYVRLINNTGAQFDGGWQIRAKQLTLTGVRPKPPTDATVGPGLAWINGLCQVMTHISVGTEVDANGRVAVVTDLSQAAKILHSAAGLILAGVVDTSTDQAIAGLKRFARLAMQPLATSGPPVTNGSRRGELRQDVDGHLWHAINGQADGDATDIWALARPAAKTYNPALTTSVAANAIHAGSITTLGNAGSVMRFRIWAYLDGPAAAAYEEVPFRIRFYPNANRLGRDQICAFAGALRLTRLSAAIAAGNSLLQADWTSAFDRGGLMVLRDLTGGTEEFGRVLSLTGGVGLDEALVNSFALNDAVSTVMELPAFPFWNDNGLHDRVLHFEIENDHDTQTVQFGYAAVIENHGHFGG